MGQVMLFHNNCYCNTSRNSIKLATNFSRRLPFSLTNLFFSCAAIVITWKTYLDLCGNSHYHYKPDYPIFHTNRYKEKLRHLGDYLLK